MFRHLHTLSDEELMLHTMAYCHPYFGPPALSNCNTQMSHHEEAQGDDQFDDTESYDECGSTDEEWQHADCEGGL